MQQEFDRIDRLKRGKQQARQSKLRKKLQRDLADSAPAFSWPENLPLEQIATYILGKLTQTFPGAEHKVLREVSHLLMPVFSLHVCHSSEISACSDN